MIKKQIKYPYLLAWDTMMGSFQYWKEMMQEKAEATNAPYTAIYWKEENGVTVWSTFEEIKSEATKQRILEILEYHGWMVKDGE